MRLKLRKIGNSFGVILPKDVITSADSDGFIEINVITFGENYPKNVITSASSSLNLPKKSQNVAYIQDKDFSEYPEENVITFE